LAYSTKNNKRASAFDAFHSLIACTTKQGKALLLVLLSLASFILSVVIEYLCYLSVGSTSLGTWYNIYWIGFFFVCGFLLSAFFVFRHDIKTKPENLFLAIVLSITCFSSISFSVNETCWDPGSHYLYVLHFAELDLTYEATVSDMEMAYTLTNDVYFNLNDLSNYADELNANDLIKDGKTIKGSILLLYMRLSSLPASLVFSICSALSVPFSIKYVLTRLIYALIYSFVTFFGMKQLKSGKMLFAVIALLPVAVFLAANYSYDYWVNAFVLFATACLVRELQTPDEPITKKRIVLLLGSFLVVFGPKAIYFPLVLLCLLVPRKKFSSPRASKLFRGCVVFISLFVAASFLFPYFFILGPGVGDTRGGPDVNSTEQILFILSSPFEYARILLNNLPGYYSFSVAKNYISYYAYLGYPQWPLWILVYALMVFTAITDKSEVDNAVCTWKSRVLALVLNVVSLILVLTAFYVAFTAVRSEIFAGCQPRYLIPQLFCTLVFLSSHRLAWPRKNDTKKTIYNATVLGLMSFVLMVGLWQVYIGLLY